LSQLIIALRSKEIADRNLKFWKFLNKADVVDHKAISEIVSWPLF